MKAVFFKKRKKADLSIYYIWKITYTVYSTLLNVWECKNNFPSKYWMKMQKKRKGLSLTLNSKCIQQSLKTLYSSNAILSTDMNGKHSYDLPVVVEEFCGLLSQAVTHHQGQ